MEPLSGNTLLSNPGKRCQPVPRLACLGAMLAGADAARPSLSFFRVICRAHTQGLVDTIIDRKYKVYMTCSHQTILAQPSLPVNLLFTHCGLSICINVEEYYVSRINRTKLQNMPVECGISSNGFRPNVGSSRARNDFGVRVRVRIPAEGSQRTASRLKYQTTTTCSLRYFKSPTSQAMPHQPPSFQLQSS